MVLFILNHVSFIKVKCEASSSTLLFLIKLLGHSLIKEGGFTWMQISLGEYVIVIKGEQYS